MEKQPLRGILIGNPTDKILFYKNVFDNKFAVIKLFFYPKKNTKTICSRFSLFLWGSKLDQLLNINIYEIVKLLKIVHHNIRGRSLNPPIGEKYVALTNVPKIIFVLLVI